MGNKFSSFKYSVGDLISTYGRNLEIIDKKYIQKQKSKDGKPFIANEKYYKYKCHNCNNEDWINEYSLSSKRHCGCNACCNPPKKVVKGINDISTTAPWAKELFKNEQDAYCHHKYSKERVEFICPFCGREYIKPIHNVISNKGLSCVCGDGVSYPNKFMYALLEQLHINFETEKRFGWSENRVYDFYIEKPKKMIIEMHGLQHFSKPIIKSDRYRTVYEEHENDIRKERLAIENGIEHYFQINCSYSNADFIKSSILGVGLLETIGTDVSKINWSECNLFATNNLIKEVCDYKRANTNVTLHQIANIYNISYKTVLQYIKTGVKYGWCCYKMNSDRKITDSSGCVDRGQKPIYCHTNNMAYRDANVAATSLTNESRSFSPRQLRKSISRGSTYKGMKFSFISKSDFNSIKINYPNRVVGDLYLCN